MPNSQFNQQAALQADGTVRVTGTVTVAEPPEDLEFRFMLVQDDVVVTGTGNAMGEGWMGTSVPGQQQLNPGPALAIGLVVLARKESGGGLGYETFTWSQQIELAQ
jgi:hypothetical protein